MHFMKVSYAPELWKDLRGLLSIRSVQEGFSMLLKQVASLGRLLR